jgi:hypothetical protein
VPCWRWDENLLWPPRQAHHDVFEPQYQCAGQSSLAIQWTTAFRQTRLDERYLLRHNDDSCFTAFNGICEDNGDGDVRRRQQPFSIMGRGVQVLNNDAYSCTPPQGGSTAQGQEYTITRIEPGIVSTRLPTVGEHIYLWPDAAEDRYQTISGNECFDGNPQPDLDGGSYGSVSPIGPLEVVEVHDENCDELPNYVVNGITVSACYCHSTRQTDDPLCSGHWDLESNGGFDFTGGSVPSEDPAKAFPRKWTYIKAKNLYTDTCTPITKTINGNGVCSELSYSLTTDRVGCGGSTSRAPGSYDANEDPPGETFYALEYCNHGGTHGVESCWGSYTTATDGNPYADRVFYPNRNKQQNLHWSTYNCGMRESVLIYGPGDAHCAYGSDRTDCGDRDDIVSYGKSSAELCTNNMNTQDHTWNYDVIQGMYPALGWNEGIAREPARFWEKGQPLNANSYCEDRGMNAHLLRTCPYGMDAVDCGHRAITLPKSKIPDREPDDSCATANNGLCEDQLFWSTIAPNDVTMQGFGMCLPNTE